jgi:transcriptional regulator GlxA family with amidase domain
VFIGAACHARAELASMSFFACFLPFALMTGNAAAGKVRSVTDIYFLVIPGTMLLDIASVAETFRIARELGAGYELHVVGPQASASCSIGLQISGIGALPETIGDGATVMIPGPMNAEVNYASSQAAESAAWLRRVIGPSQRLCTVCSGVFLAAQSGLLNGRSCTTHHLVTERLARMYPAVSVQENRIFVQDGNIYTSAGATTAFDLALHLIAEDNGPKLALEVARMLVIYLRRSGSDLQLSPWLLHRNHIHPAVHRVQDAVIRDPARRWTLESLAREACTSPRHLARVFQEHAGISPMTYVRKTRMAAAKEIVQASQHNLGRVAEMVGFSSGEQLRRAWRQFEGTNPVEARRKFA